MLGAAHAAAAGGRDVVVACVATRGRAEPSRLLDGLELMPLAAVDSGGAPGGELDVDALLERGPELAVIDEPARPNAPGARHARRWQDALELLDHGISVLTAVDIGQVESYSGIVESLAGQPLRERVPDTFLDRAEEIRVVDLSPGDPAGDGPAGILRELTLQYAARRARRDLDGRSSADGTPLAGADPGGGLLVAVGPAPGSAYLVRWARRTAYALRTGWTALHVQTGAELSRADALRLEENLALARRLGADTVVIQGEDIAGTVLAKARELGAWMIVIGRSGLSPASLFPHRVTVSDRIVRGAGSTDVVVVQDQAAGRPGPGAALRRFGSGRRGQLVLPAAAFLLTVALGALLLPLVGYRSLALLFLGAVLGLSFLADPVPVAGFAVLSALALNFLFIPPLYTFRIASLEDAILFGTYFLVASVTGGLAASKRSRERLLADRDRRNAVLLAASRRLAECHTAEGAAAAAAGLIQGHFGREVAVLMPDDGGSLPAVGQGSARVPAEGPDRDAAGYALREGAVCGAGTDTFSRAALRYLPVAAGGGAIGVIGLRTAGAGPWTRSDDALVLSIGRTLALALERARSESRGRSVAMALESQRISSLILDSVSHELRTPLTAILGSLTALQDRGLDMPAEARAALLAEAIGASERLDRLVGEILGYNRMEAGILAPRRETVSLAELAQDAAGGSADGLRGRALEIAGGDSAVLVVLDPAMISQAVANLLRNAAVHSRRPGRRPGTWPGDLQGDRRPARRERRRAGPG